MTYSAPTIIASLVHDYGWEAVVDALTEEVKNAPGEELAAIEHLLDAVMSALEVQAGGQVTVQ